MFANGLLVTGVILLVAALVYMALHLSEADAIVSRWIAFIVAGVGLVFTSILMKSRNR